jgi:beta-galactosidase
MSHEPYQASSRRAFNGKCLAIVRPTPNAGQMVVTASSTGLASSAVTIHSHIA